MVSLEPPLMRWSVARRAYSYVSFAAASHFAVHVLDAAHRGPSDRFSRASTDKFADLRWEIGMGGVPVLPGMAATFECEAEHRYDGGDHLIMVGRVVRLTIPAVAEAPLLFHRGRYAALAQDEILATGRAAGANTSAMLCPACRTGDLMTSSH
ncbi:flavin reductase (DIM6/NTAB) family NADH-FMN oxidoreductase RutF [Paraburkholderia atlantica]|nr:flavin reductase (DIM6/NTAB) family NADH-FMN oxidoreductase RutF [Paraburkholderia atlantica]